jgi:hypothetical protein
MEHTYSAIKNFLRFNGRIFIVSMKQHLCYCETEVQNRPLKRRVCVSGEIYEKISPLRKAANQEVHALICRKFPRK